MKVCRFFFDKTFLFIAKSPNLASAQLSRAWHAGLSGRGMAYLCGYWALFYVPRRQDIWQMSPLLQTHIFRFSWFPFIPIVSTIGLACLVGPNFVSTNFGGPFCSKFNCGLYQFSKLKSIRHFPDRLHTHGLEYAKESISSNLNILQCHNTELR